MIYCVVPPELGEEVFRRLSEHYKGNPNVSVIMDRRASERRKNHTGGGERARRDRRRPRAPGTLGV